MQHDVQPAADPKFRRGLQGLALSMLRPFTIEFVITTAHSTAAAAGHGGAGSGSGSPACSLGGLGDGGSAGGTPSDAAGAGWVRCIHATATAVDPVINQGL